MDSDLPSANVPRPLVAGSQDLSSTLSHIYGQHHRQSSADETIIHKLETSLSTRADPLHADYVNQLKELRDNYANTKSNLEDIEKHLLKARAARLLETPPEPPGPIRAPSLDVLRQSKLLTGLDSSALRRYQLLVPEDFCDPPKPAGTQIVKKRGVKKSSESRVLTASASIPRLDTLLPQLRKQSGDAPPAGGTAQILRAEPPSVTLHSFQVATDYELSLRVKNISCTLLWLRLVPPASPQFQLSRITFPGAQCTLAPGLSLEAKLTFRARRRQTYEDRVVVMTPLGELVVPLVASHRPPVLRMDSEISLGQVLVGCRRRRTITVTNEGGHGMFRVLRQAEWPVQPTHDESVNHACEASFSITPYRFSLETGESVELEVAFIPLSARLHHETLTLVCDNMQVQHLLVSGCGVRGMSAVVAAGGSFHEPTVGDHADKYCQHFLRLPETLPQLPASTCISLQNTTGLLLAFRWEQRPAALDIYGEDAADVGAGSDTEVAPRRGLLKPHQQSEVRFTCCTPRLGERRAVWSLMLEQLPETSLSEDDVLFQPGWPNSEIRSRLERQQPGGARAASTSCLLRYSRRLDLHALPQLRHTRCRSASPGGRQHFSDVLAYEVQTVCRCSPLPLSLEPPLLRLPDAVPFWSRVSRPVTLVNESDYSAPFRWETLRRGDLLVSVSPNESTVPAHGRLPLVVTLWSARELHLTTELRCICDQFRRSVCLPVVASFMGPSVTVSTHRLQFPRTRVGQRSECQLTLSNATKLPLEWKTARIVERTAEQPAERRWRFDSLSDPFSVWPSEGLLRASESAQVTVAFEPLAPASYDMVLDVCVDGSTRSSAVSATAEACHLSLGVTPAFHRLDAYVAGTVPLLVFVSNKCDLPVPFRWEMPPSDQIDVEIDPMEGTLLPWATLVSELTITGKKPGEYGYYCMPCRISDGSDTANLTLYGEVIPLSASIYIKPNWGHRPPGVPDLGEGREVLGRSRRAEMERQAREAEEEAARAAEPPPEPEPEPPPPPPPTTKKKKGKGKKGGGKKGKGKKAAKEEEPPSPPPPPPPEPEPEPEPAPPPEPTVEELLEQWELVDPAEADCGPLVLLFGHDVDVHTVVMRDFYVRNDTPIATSCWARVLHFPGQDHEKCQGDPPMAVEVRRINDLEREDVWSELLADGRGLALLVRPQRFSVAAHSQTRVRVFCCADMWGWYSDQLVVSGEGIPDLTVDLRVGVTGSPVLVVNTGSNHVRFGCQLYGSPPVERHLCLNNVSPCPIQLNMSVALTSPSEGRPPPFRATISVGADFEPLLSLWEWRVADDTIQLGLRPVFGEEQQAHYTVTPDVVVVPARAKAWLLVQLHPVCLAPAASHWEWLRRQQPLDVLAWLTAHMSLRPMDVTPEGGHVRRTHGYRRAPLQVQLRAQLRTAYLEVAYPECVAVGLRPAPVLAGPEQVVRMVAPVTALVEGPRRFRLLSHITLHNCHQVDVEVLCWSTLPFEIVRAASPRGTLERPGRCVVPHSGHTQLTVEFVFSRSLLQFCLTECLDPPQRVRFSANGQVTVLPPPEPGPEEECTSGGESQCSGETPTDDDSSAAPMVGSERILPLKGGDSELDDTEKPDQQRKLVSESDLDRRYCRPSDSLQHLLCERTAQIAAQKRAANDCLHEVEVEHLTGEETGEQRVRFTSRVVLQYMDSYVQALPVQCTLVLPSLRVSTEDVQFDQVTVGDQSQLGFYIANPTIGEISWTSRLLARLPSPRTSSVGLARLASGRRRSTRVQPRRPDAATFRLSPESGVLRPRARAHVTVTFAPLSCALYSATVELTGPCLPEPVVVRVTGEGTHDELPHMPGT